MIFFRPKTYQVQFEEDDWVAPEETLIDSSSRYADVETPLSGLVFRSLLGVCAVLLSVVALFVFRMAVVDHSYFAALALQNKSANFPLSPPRGIIFDSHGVPLVENVPRFDVLVISRELVGRDDYDVTVRETARALGQNEDVFVSFMREKTQANAIFFAYTDITKDQALALDLLAGRGIYVVSSTKRLYPDGNMFSAIVGYTGNVHKEDIDEDAYYFPTDDIGKLGIEAAYETTLRGEHGNIFFTAEHEGSVNKNPTVGRSIMLHIDADIQRQLYRVMRTVLVESGLSRGAAVIQNPQNGAVLAMVSFPSFDNNIFSDGLTQDDVERLFQSRTRPLFNRVVSGTYNPGSTIKPLIGMAALEEKIVSPADTIWDCVSVTVGNFIFRNWREEYGPFNLKKAIANSCNVYFYSIGGGYGNIRGLGITRIADYLKRSFADTVLGIDMPGEAAGFVPTPAWKEERRGESWYLGDTYNVSIGQGDLSVTPLWLNTYISAIANGGTVYKPSVARGIVDTHQEIVQEFPTAALGTLPFSSSVIREMKEAMKETTITGTAKILNDLPVRVAAKTGTAEVVKGQSINALFTAFAPADDAELALTILVEGSAENQGYSIRVANGFLRWYFIDRLTPSPTPEPVP